MRIEEKKIIEEKVVVNEEEYNAIVTTMKIFETMSNGYFEFLGKNELWYDTDEIEKTYDVLENFIGSKDLEVE